SSTVKVPPITASKARVREHLVRCRRQYTRVADRVRCLVSVGAGRRNENRRWGPRAGGLARGHSRERHLPFTAIRRNACLSSLTSTASVSLEDEHSTKFFHLHLHRTRQQHGTTLWPLFKGCSPYGASRRLKTLPEAFQPVFCLFKFFMCSGRASLQP